jgi:hypothetical protein
MTEHIVAAGTSFAIKRKVSVGDVVSWTFRTRKKDIVFRTIFTPSKGALVKTESKYLPTDGWASHDFHCDADGDFEVIWDNTASYLTAKTLLYSLDVAERSTLQQGGDKSSSTSTRSEKS